MIIDVARFIAAERPSWTELETLLKKIESAPHRRIALDDAKRFHFLYQKVSADLGRIATFSAEPQLRRYLESLVARAYGEIHASRESGNKREFGAWLLQDFPRAFRRNSQAFVISVVITIVGMVFGGFALALDDSAKSALLPRGFDHLLDNPRERVEREEKAKHFPAKEYHATFAENLMTHNIEVSVLAMALGMGWAIGTVTVLFFNGVILGLIGLDYIINGQTVFVLGWLLPHGVIEIPAILIGGQAGLLLGKAVIGRGDRAKLSERLRDIRGDVAALVGGVMAMLVWAGIVESFFSQYHQPILPYWLKITFGCCELAVLVWFLRTAGLESGPIRPTEEKAVPAQ
ncbi:MAG TPA: stage II sporulation protein M [Chthoniobacteraceae bacterium]|jgi:uncharacterized membrane protein SpoIIM required for sporulation